jgi:hypothetical protein
MKIMSNIYKDNGFDNREEYLKDLAEQYDVDFVVVYNMAETLGPTEDFDGLINMLEDMHHLY